MMAGLAVREATSHDTQGILETLKLALGETGLLRRTPELWRWKHELNPFGPSIVLVCVGPDGTIAGVRAFMRWDLVSARGVTVKCVRAVDTATHPDYTRRGIFRTLTMEAVAIAEDRGIDMIFNTPNEKSGPGYLSMGWGHVTWVGAQVRLRAGNAANVSPGKAPRIADLAPQALDVALIPEDSRAESASAMSTPRSAAYMNWRFRLHPSASYGWVPGVEGSGLVVRASSRNGRAELVASDLLGAPHRSAIVNAARISRARYMAGWFSPGTTKRRVSVRAGLLPVPGLKALRLVAYPLTQLHSDPFDIGSWDLSTSDLELL